MMDNMQEIYNKQDLREIFQLATACYRDELASLIRGGADLEDIQKMERRIRYTESLSYDIDYKSGFYWRDR